MKKLLDYLLKGIGDVENMNDICYRTSSGKIIRNKNREYITDLDSLPIPDRSIFDVVSYTFPTSIFTSRGCPGNCIFCAATALSGECYRIRSDENIVDEFLNIMINQNIKMIWNCESRVDIMTKFTSEIEGSRMCFNTVWCRSRQSGNA